MKTFIIDAASYENNGISTGHYFGVAENLYNVFKPKHETIIAGGPIYNTKFKHNLFKLKYGTSNTSSIISNKLHTILNVRQVFKEADKSDILIWQSSSVATTLLGIILFGSKKYNSFLIQYNTLMLSNFILKLIYYLVKPKIKGVICTLEEVGKAYKKPYCIVPDYIYCNDKVENYIPFQDRQYDFCMVGIICEDKGIVEVAQKLKNTKYNIIIAGKPTNEYIKNQLIDIVSKCTNIELKLQYLSDDKYDYYIRNSKYCILNYKGSYSHHSSGVVYDVIFKGTPIIGSSCKAFDFIKENKLGFLFNELSTWDPSSCINKNVHQIYIENIQKYFNIHISFREKINSFINKLINE